MPCISMGSETPVLPVKALSIKLDGITPFISPMLSESQLVKKEMGDHGKTPSYRWRNEGILPSFQAVGISRRLEVHDRMVPVEDNGDRLLNSLSSNATIH